MSQMSIYADPAYDMACEQFRLLADYLNLDSNIRQRMLYPSAPSPSPCPSTATTAAITVFRATACSTTSPSARPRAASVSTRRSPSAKSPRSPCG